MSLAPAAEQSAGFMNFLTWARRAKPFPYSRGVANTAMALLYVIGGFTTMVVLLFPHPPTLNDGLIIGLGAPSIIIGAAVFKLRQRIPAAALPWLLAAGVAIITILTATGGSTSATVSFSFFYMWVVVYALLFLNPRAATLLIGSAAAAYISVVALLGEQPTNQLTAFEPIILISVVITTGGVIMWLAQARQHSEIDPLTRVVNRRGLDRILYTALNENTPATGPMVVGMIDVDHFKDVNDLLGHAAGDQLLEDITEVWRGVLRCEDTLGRVGGDEFVVVLPGCSPADADHILERLREAVLHLKVTCSVGAALSEPGDSASMLLGRADTALYLAKSLGRNQVAWATE